MQVTRRRSGSDFLRGLFLLSHPGPVFIHLLAVTIFALLAAWPRFNWGVIGLVVAAHTAMQLSIAMLNDYSDRRADAVGKPKKPIPRGLIRPNEALMAGVGMIVVMLLLLLPLPRLALGLSLAYLLLGQVYNFGLKGTPFSGVVFALAMPLIPIYAFAGVGHLLPVLYWLLPMGLLLGVALNLANSLPDLEEDEASGVRTLAVALGVRRSYRVCTLLVGLGALLILTLHLTGALSVQNWILWPLLGLTVGGVITATLLSRPGKPVETRKAYFYCIAFTCLILIGGWLLGALI